MHEVIVFGGSGYTGVELIRLLARHPAVRLCGASSGRWAGERIADRVAAWPGDERFIDHESLRSLIKAGRVAFLATPASTSHDLVPELIGAGVTVIDLSGAFRLATPKAHMQWYGFPHTHPELLDCAHYGLPELFEPSYAGGDLIANPGCYATAAILAVAPLVGAGLIDTSQPIIMDGKSGTTGAGRKADEALLFSEVADSVRPYRLAKHQHTPEIEQALAQLAGTEVRVSFTAHLLPIRRGLLVSAYLSSVPGLDQKTIDAAYRSAYEPHPFVRVISGRVPEPGPVGWTNFCDVSATLDRRTGTIMAFGAIDNLVKGAAGQAIQNLNALLGIETTTGLIGVSF